MRDEVLDLRAGSLAQGLRPAEVDGVSFHKGGIKLMLADDLAEAVADLGTTVVPVSRLWRDLARLRLRLGRLADRTDLLDRADPDPVRLAQGPIDRARFCDTHLGPT